MTERLVSIKEYQELEIKLYAAYREIHRLETEIARLMNELKKYEKT